MKTAAVCLLFVACIGFAAAQEETGAKVHKVYPLWGFAIVDPGKLANVEPGDQLAVMTRNRQRASLKVAAVEPGVIVVEVPEPKGGSTLVVVAGVPVIAHIKMAEPVQKSKDGEVVGWNRDWGFKVVRNKRGEFEVVPVDEVAGKSGEPKKGETAK